ATMNCAGWHTNCARAWALRKPANSRLVTVQFLDTRLGVGDDFNVAWPFHFCLKGRFHAENFSRRHPARRFLGPSRRAAVGGTKEGGNGRGHYGISARQRPKAVALSR